MSCYMFRCGQRDEGNGVCQAHLDNLTTRRSSPITKAFLAAVRKALPTCIEDWTWRDKAKCAGLKSHLDDVCFNHAPSARQLCHWCPVRAECAAFSIANGERYGTWGGVHETERKVLALMLDAKFVANIPVRESPAGVSVSPFPPVARGLELDGRRNIWQRGPRREGAA